MEMYKSFEQLPIFNYWKMVSESNLKYLLKTDVFELPENLTKEEEEQLKQAYVELFKKTESVDLLLQNLYIENYKSLLDYLYEKENKKNLQKCNNVFSKYLNQIDVEYKDFVFNNKKYDLIKDAYNEWKVNIAFENLFQLRLEIFDYRKLNAIKKNNIWDLYEEIGYLRQILNFDIDEFNTSVKKYNSYKKIAIQKIETQNKK